MRFTAYMAQRAAQTYEHENSLHDINDIIIIDFYKGGKRANICVCVYALLEATNVDS